MFSPALFPAGIAPRPTVSYGEEASEGALVSQRTPGSPAQPIVHPATASRAALVAILAAGVAYGVIGVAFGAVANGAATGQGRFGWRLAAWVVSAIIFAAHIAYAHLRVRWRPSLPSTALQGALGAALGSFLLAVAATVHAFWIGAPNRSAFGLALVVWPVGTAVPAFVAAFAAAAVLALLRRRI
jgi:hypothetical protein